MKRAARTWIMLALALLLGGAIIFAFWPRAMVVDTGTVVRQPLVVTIDEEAKTRVREAYLVSAPVAGRIRRVEVEPGDAVQGGVTVIARMLPLPPSALDVRTRDQARAAVSAAEAALRVARADLNKAVADKDLTDLDLERSRRLRESGTVAQANLDRAQRAWRAARASLDTARAAIAMREAELANARARLISFSEPAVLHPGDPGEESPIPITAPVSGRILQVLQKSETTLAAGTPILEIGDISNDLEIVVELLSTDAVKVVPGNRVIIEKWGQDTPLAGRVDRVEPWGFTKFSALGVEEQRVKAIVSFSDPPERRQGLGHGFRVETRIVIWETDAALSVPMSALFRQGADWATFVLEEGRAQLRNVRIGRQNGLQAEVLEGLEADERVVLYPAPGLADGQRLRQRRLE